MFGWHDIWKCVRAPKRDPRDFVRHFLILLLTALGKF
jgi:hypothetical protein